MSAPCLNPDRIVWIDAETTGLNARTDELLEIAVVITDMELNELASYSTVIHQFQRAKAVARMEPVVLQMHASSGLLEELATTTEATAMPRVHEALLEMVADHGALGAVVGGSNPGFDRGFLDHWMRELNREALHYRSIDVSTIKELARVHAPEVLESAPVKSYQHRALPDIRESIAELRHYLDAGLMASAYKLTKENERLRSGGKTLGEIIKAQCDDIVAITRTEHLIDATGDGDWEAVWSAGFEMRDRLDAAEKELVELRAALAAEKGTNR